MDPHVRMISQPIDSKSLESRLVNKVIVPLSAYDGCTNFNLIVYHF